VYWKSYIPLDGGRIDLLDGYSGSINGRNQFAASSIGTSEFEMAGIFLNGSKQERVRDSSYWMRISRRRLRQQLYRHLILLSHEFAEVFQNLKLSRNIGDSVSDILQIGRTCNV
jgi:hypothetical protein